ncbi:MAG TPA: hypothetical protein VHG08_10245 [Longimicrobium sp.]|nr:hypothetical protein [Longimicrobium sp.]
MSNTLIVKNSVGVPITVLDFIKYFGDAEDGGLPPNSVMNPGQELSFVFQGGSGSGDYYGFDICTNEPIDTLGGPIYQAMGIRSKRCDIELDDIASPNPTVVEFFANTFSVGTPISSGCFNNYYEYVQQHDRFCIT